MRWTFLQILALSLVACGGRTPSAPDAAAERSEAVLSAAPSADPLPDAEPNREPAEGPLVLTTLSKDDSGKTLAQRFADERAAAGDAGVALVVMFTADWCTPCRTIKDLLTDSDVVRQRVGGGRFVMIDVDEWRGPAQRLIRGADPSKLPLLVRVDAEGELVQQTHGTALGLLSEEAAGDNLRRLFQGQAPGRPAYLDDDDKKRDLIRADIARKRESTQGVAAFEARVTHTEALSDGRARHTLQLVIRNQDSRRRWYVLPTAAAEPTEALTLQGASVERFTEHVRAGVRHYGGADGLTLIAVAGWGSVKLEGWIVETQGPTPSLAVWRTDRVRVDGQRLKFAKKVAYALEIADAAARATIRRSDREVALSVKVADRYVVQLPQQ